ncbi:hypothetical protein JCM19235_970 [Vibrio maritimus]|uniref:PEP-utilising enzyme C-terminal domain-containing protein n=1 Tax=Vibrio maritimus TaxID=990268 RepID=A0A090RZE2_9VIBR|nr:hypothetical protein JCM19235_970 [Vibrio maritimus]
MVSSVQEFDDAATLIEQAYQEVLVEHPEVKKPEIGVMIEVPLCSTSCRLWLSGSTLSRWGPMI